MEKDEIIIKYQEKLKEITDSFELLNISEIGPKKIKFLFGHTPCGTTFTTDFYSLKASILKNGGCPKCSMEKRIKNLHHKITKEEFSKYLKDTNENDYIVKDVWFNEKARRSYSKLFHIVCENEFTQRINDFKSGYRCPICAMSKRDSFLTLKIKDYLESKNIKYKTEIDVPLGRSSNRKLKNDFNFNTNFYIESDGEQHFMQKAHRDLLEIIRERDLSKDNYFFENKEKNYYLRIPYNELENVETILDLFISGNFNQLKNYRVLLISNKTIFNYENEDYYKENSSKRKNCRNKTMLNAGNSERTISSETQKQERSETIPDECKEVEV